MTLLVCNIRELFYSITHPLLSLFFVFVALLYMDWNEFVYDIFRLGKYAAMRLYCRDELVEFIIRNSFLLRGRACKLKYITHLLKWILRNPNTYDKFAWQLRSDYVQEW